MDDKVVGVDVFAQMIGVSEEHARRLCREGKAPRHFRVGKTIRFKESDILEWIQKRTVNPDND